MRWRLQMRRVSMCSCLGALSGERAAVGLCADSLFVLQYTDDKLLKDALAVVEETNKAAVRHAESCRSYALTDEERAAADAGRLDIITGFQVVDANWRMLVLEGLVDGGMSTLLSRLGRDFANSPVVKYLANPDVQFTNRLYGVYNLAPKDIRLRDPLSVIMKQPGLYNRLKVGPPRVRLCCCCECWAQFCPTYGQE